MLKMNDRVQFYNTGSDELEGKYATVIGVATEFPGYCHYIVMLDERMPSKPDHMAIQITEHCLKKLSNGVPNELTDADRDYLRQKTD